MYASAFSDVAERPRDVKASRPLRIVHCFRSPVGGIFRHVRDLCEAQEEAGHKVGIVCDSTTGGAFEDHLFEQIRDRLSLGLLRIPMQRNLGIGDLAASWRVLSAIRRMKPDILHGHGAKGGAYARLFGSAMRFTGRPVARLYSPHGGSLHYDEHSVAGRIFFILEAIMGRLTDHIIFVSDYERRVYEQKIGHPYPPSCIVYNGLRRSEFEPVEEANDAADFLYVGMMRDLKGPDLFIDALKRAEKQSGRSLTAVMVGDGEERRKYAEQAEMLGFGDRITFHSAKPAREAFALGHILVVPSRAEAMPYIVLEALAAGKPIIASAVGGIPEILGETSPALCQPNVGSISDKIISASADEKAYRAAMPSRQRLEKLFSVEAMAKQVEEIYRRYITPGLKQ